MMSAKAYNRKTIFNHNSMRKFKCSYAFLFIQTDVLFICKFCGYFFYFSAEKLFGYKYNLKQKINVWRWFLRKNLKYLYSKFGV